jgi:hypothetical protein
VHAVPLEESSGKIMTISPATMIVVYALLGLMGILGCAVVILLWEWKEARSWGARQPSSSRMPGQRERSQDAAATAVSINAATPPIYAPLPVHRRRQAETLQGVARRSVIRECYPAARLTMRRGIKADALSA